MFGKMQTEWYYNIIYLVAFIFIIRAVQRAFFRPVESVDDHILRAKHWVSYLGAHKKAIRVLEKALEIPNITTLDRDNIYLAIGNEYYLMKDFVKASSYFEKIVELFGMKKLLFNKVYLNVIMSYYNAGRKDEARALYHKLKKQEKYDPKYGYLDSLTGRIFK